LPEEPAGGLRLSATTLTIIGVVGIPLVTFAISVLGEVRTNRLRLDSLEHEVVVLKQHDEESAKDRRGLDNRLYRLEDGHERLAPARGRE
jgi:hypothetical protein